MVGNDVDDDMVPAMAIGMKTFLLTEYLINKGGADISRYDHGGYDALLEYVKAL